uniref:2-hydroxyhepta-2,4-diene-1,7-dioate isomerase n=1 Tax=Acidobacterium capsulatum TaxID=33075 RepID=A0A7V5CSI1_9BACT
MKLYNTTQGIFAQSEEGIWRQVEVASWDELVSSENLGARARAASGPSLAQGPAPETWLAPIGTQEVWAAGVTYFRSRSARMEESKDAGGGTFYDRVYSAERPELFFKATARRVVGPGAAVRIRSDARWSVPEPELTLLLNPHGEIAGYTIGNDMSSRDIEGENPLYLPQAKVYDGSCALGPCLLVAERELPRATGISLAIQRQGVLAFQGQTTLEMLKRDPRELAAYLFRESSFPGGAYLMTGTGIVPEDNFTLAPADRISIRIEGIGTLENFVE